VLPAASTFTALLTMVGTEWVAGSTMPITPQGARSTMQRPVASLRASPRIASTPTTYFIAFSLAILWSRRPMRVSSISILPSSSARSSQRRRMRPIIRPRSSRDMAATRG